jgi:hypothetical protein
MKGMAREKVTVTLDRRKIADARALIGGKSTSHVIDVALDRLLRAERLRRDIAAYRRQPVGPDETWASELPVELDLEDSDVDYERDYGRRR